MAGYRASGTSGQQGLCRVLEMHMHACPRQGRTMVTVAMTIVVVVECICDSVDEIGRAHV